MSSPQQHQALTFIILIVWVTIYTVCVADKNKTDIDTENKTDIDTKNKTDHNNHTDDDDDEFEKNVRRAFVIGNNLYFIEDYDDTQENVYFFNFLTNYLSYTTESLYDLFDNKMSAIYSVSNLKSCSVIKTGCQVKDPYNTVPVHFTLMFQILTIISRRVSVAVITKEHTIEFHHVTIQFQLNGNLTSHMIVDVNHFQGVVLRKPPNSTDDTLEAFIMKGNKMDWNPPPAHVINLNVFDLKKNASNIIKCTQFRAIIDHEHIIMGAYAKLVENKVMDRMFSRKVSLETNYITVYCYDAIGCVGKECITYYVQLLELGSDEYTHHYIDGYSDVDDAEFETEFYDSIFGYDDDLEFVKQKYRLVKRDDLRDEPTLNTSASTTESHNSSIYTMFTNSSIVTGNTSDTHSPTTLGSTTEDDGLNPAPSSICDGIYESECPVSVYGRLRKKQELVLIEYTFTCERGCWFCDEVCRPKSTGYVRKIRPDVSSEEFVSINRYFQYDNLGLWIVTKSAVNKSSVNSYSRVAFSEHNVTSAFYLDNNMYVLFRGKNKLVKLNDSVILSANEPIDLDTHKVIEFEFLAPNFKSILLGDLMINRGCRNCTDYDNDLSLKMKILLSFMILALLVILILLIMII